jgi:hypothetical protein
MLTFVKEHLEVIDQNMVKDLVRNHGFNMGGHFEDEKLCSITYKTILEENDPRLGADYLK